MNPVSHTAYYCCGARMVDANSSAPLCNDIYAHRFMDEDGQRIFSELKASKHADAACVVRARMVEDHLRRFISEDKNQNIILVGAGFDSKAYRLPGGCWYEIDETPIIERKNQCLPVDLCPNSLIRRTTNFSANELSRLFSNLDNSRPPIFVIEGVLMYLSETEIETLLSSITEHFPKHTIICDLMSSAFIKLQMQRFLDNIARFQCSFKFRNDDPVSFFTARNYTVTQKKSIVERSVEFNAMGIPMFILKTFAPELLRGYSVCCLEH